MIKKLIILFLATALFVWSILPSDYYNYIGKNVKVEVWGGYFYEGNVEDVIEIKECIEKDGFNDCVFYKTRYNMFLRTAHRVIILRCEDIIDIDII